MSMTLKERGLETVHDQVVSLIAQRWAKVFHCKVTIQTGLEHNPWADPNQQCVDIIGWFVSSGGHCMEWMAEVETAESLADPQTVARWRKAVARGIPFYLLVPRGLKEPAQKLAQDASVVFSCVYEYTFLNDVCHVL
ncbi:MAG TPA: hypothetical protein VFS39_09675 [Nitrospira sp.]|nr:hypothetical protein [Nitrospira sp.]